MLNQLVEQLGLIPVLDEPTVQRLKQYIRVKFPMDSGGEHARTLANTVHRVVDRELWEFSPSLRNSIRLEALKAAVGKGSFSVNAGDLFEACVKVLPQQSRDGSPPDAQAEALIDAQVVAWLNRQRLHPDLSQTPIVQIDALRGWLDPDLVNRETTVEPWPLDTSGTALTSGTTLTMGKPLTIGTLLARGKPLPRGLTYAIVLLLFLAPLFQALPLNTIITSFRSAIYSQTADVPTSARVVNSSPANQLPSFLKYKEVKSSNLKAYLKARDSLLAEEPYFTTVVESSREFDVNPLVLFAIAGHEQGFVPRKGPNSSRIINNPFNVFHSWKEYNTDIKDSSRTAARTIVHAAEGRPADVNPFLWLNRRYAEDVNWWKGVNSIYSDLEEAQ